MLHDWPCRPTSGSVNTSGKLPSSTPAALSLLLLLQRVIRRAWSPASVWPLSISSTCNCKLQSVWITSCSYVRSDKSRLLPGSLSSTPCLTAAVQNMMFPDTGTALMRNVGQHENSPRDCMTCLTTPVLQKEEVVVSDTRLLNNSLFFIGLFRKTSGENVRNHILFTETGLFLNLSMKMTPDFSLFLKKNRTTWGGSEAGP